MSAPGSIALIEKGAHRLAFYSLSGAFESAIALPHYPHEMARDPDGRTAYVGHYGALNSADPAPGGSTVIVVDLIERRIVSQIDLRPYRRLHGLQCDSRGRLFALAEADDVLLVVDQPKAATTAARAMRTGGVKGHLVAVTSDGECAFCTNLLSHSVTRVAPFSPGISPLVIEPGPKPEGLCFSADESRLMVLNRGDGTLVQIDTRSGRVIRTVQLRGEATRIYRLGQDAFLIAFYANQSVSLHDARTLEESALLKLDGRVTAASVDSNRSEALASLESDHLVRIDLRSFTEISRFRTGRDPDVSTFV